MELEASSRPRGPLTDAENQFQKERGLCNCCGGHVFGTASPKLAQYGAIQAARFAVKSRKLSILPIITEEPKDSLVL